MITRICGATTATGDKCRNKPNASGYCSIHDPARRERGENKKKAKGKFLEAVECVLKTASAKGWTAWLTSQDDTNWKYASVAVKRWAGNSNVEGNFDISIDGGVKVSLQRTTPFSPYGLKDLHDSIMEDLGKLTWLTSSKEKKVLIPAITKLERILKSFHRVARQLLHRHDDRETLVITDEYDVQDLLHAMLRIDFDDIRPEEYSPSYAGGASRIDFLLKKEKILIEVKMTNKKLKDKQVGEQLIIDSQRYKTHPDCETLVCFVYDPNGFLKNPVGLSADLSGKQGDLLVKVIVVPEH